MIQVRLIVDAPPFGMKGDIITIDTHTATLWTKMGNCQAVDLPYDVPVIEEPIVEPIVLVEVPDDKNKGVNW